MRKLQWPEIVFFVWVFLLGRVVSGFFWRGWGVSGKWVLFGWLFFFNKGYLLFCIMLVVIFEIMGTIGQTRTENDCALSN